MAGLQWMRGDSIRDCLRLRGKVRTHVAVRYGEEMKRSLPLGQGTLDLVVLRALVAGSMHGYGIAMTNSLSPCIETASVLRDD